MSPQSRMLTRDELLDLVDDDSKRADSIMRDVGLFDDLVQMKLGAVTTAGTLEDAALGCISSLHLRERAYDGLAVLAMPVVLTHQVASRLLRETDLRALVHELAAFGLVLPVPDDSTVIGQVPDVFRRVLRLQHEAHHPEWSERAAQVLREVLTDTGQSAEVRLRQAVELHDVEGMISVLQPTCMS